MTSGRSFETKPARVAWISGKSSRKDFQDAPRSGNYASLLRASFFLWPRALQPEMTFRLRRLPEIAFLCCARPPFPLATRVESRKDFQDAQRSGNNDSLLRSAFFLWPRALRRASQGVLVRTPRGYRRIRAYPKIMLSCCSWPFSLWPRALRRASRGVLVRTPRGSRRKLTYPKICFFLESWLSSARDLFWVVLAVPARGSRCDLRDSS